MPRKAENEKMCTCDFAYVRGDDSEHRSRDEDRAGSDASSVASVAASAITSVVSMTAPEAQGAASDSSLSS